MFVDSGRGYESGRKNGHKVRKYNKRLSNRRVVADEKEEDVTNKLSFQFNSCANGNINCFIKNYI